MRTRRKTLAVWFGTVLLALGYASASAVASARLVVMPRGSALEEAFLEEVKQAFRGKHPDIEVEIVVGPGGGADFRDRLYVMHAAGEAPDLFGHSSAFRYVWDGLALDITEYIKRDMAELDPSDWIPGTMETFMLGDRYYGLPIAATSSFTAYNVELFDRTGLEGLPTDWNERSWTWDSLVDYARKLTIRLQDGRVEQAGVTGLDPGQAWPWYWGGDWLADRNKFGIPTRAAFTDPFTVSAYEQLAEINYVRRAHFAPEDEWSSAREGFPDGNAGMYHGNAWIFRGWVDTIEFEWSLAPVFYTPMGNRSNLRFGDPWLISSQTQHPEEAWEFLKFITGKEMSRLFVDRISFMSPRISAIPAYIDRMSGIGMDQQLCARPCWAPSCTRGSRTTRAFLI